MRRQVGTVAELWRYPVKSMRGERVEEMLVTERGAAGDRLYAMRELKYGGIMSARMFASMLQLRATCESLLSNDTPARVRIDLPDGSAVYAGDPRTDEILTDLFGFAVRLERPREGPLSMEEIDEIREGRAFLPPRDLYDEDVMHVLASGTLAHLRGLRAGDSDFDVRRFRPNIYVDSGADADGFVEDGWLDSELRVGNDGARIIRLRPALRCAMTIHPQDELRPDPAILRTAAQHHGAYVGVFASVGAPGRVRTGDPVWLVTERP
jgi:uncharacterized protein YcbX